MSIFGRKLSHFAHKAGRKFHVKDIKKFGTKAIHEGHHLAHDIAKHSKETYHDAKKYGKVALHGVDKGLVLAHRFVGGANIVIRKASNIASKMESVPALGEFAGMASSGLKQLGSGVATANKGIKGLVIAHKVVGGANKVIKKASSIAGKLEGVPVLGEFAGMASSGLKQLGSGVSVANKGIKGLERATKKVSHLGHTIDRSGKAFKSGNDDRIAGSLKDISQGFHGMKNPLKR